MYACLVWSPGGCHSQHSLVRESTGSDVMGLPGCPSLTHASVDDFFVQGVSKPDPATKDYIFQQVRSVSCSISLLISKAT